MRLPRLLQSLMFGLAILVPAVAHADSAVAPAAAGVVAGWLLGTLMVGWLISVVIAAVLQQQSDPIRVARLGCWIGLAFAAAVLLAFVVPVVMVVAIPLWAIILAIVLLVVLAVVFIIR